MPTFTVIQQSIQDNLNDQGVYFSATDLTNALQTAYNISVALSQCIIKKVAALPFLSNVIYYNFQDNTNYPTIYVADFMACTAIFSNNTNLWLLDDKALKDFDRDRIDFENWQGQPVWWAPTNDYRRTALIPYLGSASGNFDLYYYAQAPTVVGGNSPLMPPDFHYLIEVYASSILCEIAQEFVKAKNYLAEFYGEKDNDQNYDEGIFKLADRSKNIAKSDLLMIG